MIKKFICIECPKGCSLEVNIENGKVLSVKGNKCKRGEKYAQSEVEFPLRILASSVKTEGLDLKMLPVRTSAGIPKSKMSEAMNEIKRITISKPVKAGDVIVENFLDLKVNLAATRNAVEN